MRILPSQTPAFALALCLCCACSVPPDARELRRHLAAAEQLGWNGLQIEAVSILECVEAGEDWKVDASYRIRLTHDRHALPPQEQERIVHRLPMCDAILNREGDHCTLRESVIFTRSAYGWMPRELALGKPDLLPRIAEEGKKH